MLGRWDADPGLDAMEIDQDVAADSVLQDTTQCFFFRAGHPQRRTHCHRARAQPALPQMLASFPPRPAPAADPAVRAAYAALILANFASGRPSPWCSRVYNAPLTAEAAAASPQDLWDSFLLWEGEAHTTCAAARRVVANINSRVEAQQRADLSRQRRSAAGKTAGLADLLASAMAPADAAADSDDDGWERDPLGGHDGDGDAPAEPVEEPTVLGEDLEAALAQRSAGGALDAVRAALADAATLPAGQDVEPLPDGAVIQDTGASKQGEQHFVWCGRVCGADADADAPFAVGAHRPVYLAAGPCCRHRRHCPPCPAGRQSQVCGRRPTTAVRPVGRVATCGTVWQHH